MKKFLSLLLAAMLLLSCIPAMAEDDPEWKINQYTGLVSRKSAAEKLESIVIPAEVNGMAVRGIEYMAFNMHKNFKQLTIADNAAMLDRRVLRDLLKLEVVDLPENLLIIREGNFTNLPKLTSVVIPANVVLVHSSFNKCASLTSITFEGMCPLFVTEGTFGMFTELPADCVIYVPDDQLESYKEALADRADVVARLQPSGQKAIRVSWPVNEGDFQFDAATGTITGYTGTANYLKIPASIGGVQVKHIADDALLQKHSLCCIVVPEGVESLGAASLAGVENLSYVSLPSTLTSVGDSAFSVSRVSAISYNTASVPAYDAAAFANIKSDAWQLILPFGTSQEQVDAFAAYMAAGAPKGVTKASIIEPYTFPKLDAEAGAPFIGNWTAVAVFDGVDYYGMDLLGISMIVNLQGDGTGVVDMDGDATSGGWYVEDGTVVFAPILEEGGQPVPEEAMTFTMDENGRMVLDLGGLYLLLEMEGKTYAVPAIPEKPWPELDQSNAKYFIGTWEAVSYIMEGETYSAELMGKMMLTLNDDGTATSVEPGEEPYALRWYADYGTAYVGPAMSALAKITFDGNGNIKMEQDGMSIIMAPYVEELTTPVVENPSDLTGTWIETDGMGTLTINADGTAVMNYSDGTVYDLPWKQTATGGEFTGGMWWGSPMELQLDGSLAVDGGWMVFVREGEEYVGGNDYSEGYDDYELPEAQPIGPEGEAYFGAWKADMYGMEVIMTLNQDGTCTMDMMGEVEPGVWAVVDGKANVMGDELYIDGDGNLVYEGAGMVFTKTEGGASSEEMSDEEMLLALMALMGQMEGMENEPEQSAPVEYIPATMDDYIGGWICTDDPTMQILLLEGEASLIEGSELYTTTWTVVDGVAEFDGMKLYTQEDWSGILDMGGELVKFERGYVEKPKAPANDSSDEMSDEELMALLALLAQMEGGDAGSELPENLKPFVGTWHMVYIATGGFEGDLRSMGMTGKLELNADGTGKLSGAADDSGSWYDDEGTVRFGKADTPLVLLDNGFLRYGNQLAGYMVFSQDASATWTPAPVAPLMPAQTAVPAAPAASVASGEGGYVGKTFVLTSASTVYAGQAFPVDAAAFGEYKVCFHEGGKATFVQAGLELPADYLVWSINADGAYVLTYAMGATVIMEYVFTPADGALTMDYYGTMMTFTPAE